MDSLVVLGCYVMLLSDDAESFPVEVRGLAHLFLAFIKKDRYFVGVI